MLDFRTEFYKNLFDSLDNNAVIMRVEQDGTYEPIWCTEEFAEMMEGTVEECISRENTAMSSVHPDDREEVAYLFKNHKTKNGANNLTIRKYTVKGNIIWVNLHFAFVEEEGIQYAYCNYTNVTEIKESQAKAENMYESIRDDLESLAEGALSFLRVNLTRDKLLDIRGSDTFQFDQSPGVDHVKEWQRYLPLESDRKRFAERISPDGLINTFLSGQDYLEDYFFTQRKDGRKCFVKVTENIRQDPATGDIISFFTEYDYNNEMVNKTILNKALVEQYDMITSLIDGVYSVVIGDREHFKGESIFPKKETGDYETYIEEEVIPYLSGTDEEIAAMADSLRHDTIVKQLNENESYETDIVCNLNGETRYKRMVYYVASREAKFYVLLKSDITDVIKEQQEKNELLASALEGAQQANAAKTSFLSNMSHEIRTPMNAIIGLDSIALSDPELPDKTRDYLTKIDSSAKHLLGLINDILDMTRIESGRMTLKNEEFSFNQMLEQVNTLIGGQCQDKHLNYKCNVIGDVADYYTGDDMKLKQVLINILGNSVKFTPEGGNVTLSVERVNQFDGKSTLCFKMKDTGVGMDEEFVPKIFDAFTQENENRSDKYGSTGLGMAITKNIVEMMNGTIDVESEKGVGSTFIVNVTLKDSDRKEQRRDLIRPQEMKVMVIDDDPVDCEHAKLVLEEVGINADTVQSGSEALKMIEVSNARREFYDLILVDWKMPELNGIEVTKKIREIYGNKAAIIILTAYSYDDVIDEGKDSGVDSFMAKPLFAANVLEEFYHALSRKSMSGKEATSEADLTGRHILLAEDMMINAEIMKELLKMKDMHVDHAENGQAVIDKFAESPENYYDAILMDVRMPIKTGLEATEEIRDLDRADAKSIPIIALTANAFDEDVQRSLQAGMNAHLSKPVDPEILYKTLSSLIQDK